jgi:uncharacterized protein (TIGR03382 family)
MLMLRTFLFSLEDGLYRLFVADSKRAYRIALVAVVIAVAATSAILLVGGAAPQRSNCGDAIFMLDYAWRYECGQRPHVDYYDFLGPTSLLPLLAGMSVGGRNCNAFTTGSAILSPLVALIGWWVARRRFPAFFTACIVLMVVGLVIGVYPAGCGATWRDIGNSEYYNRFQWSLLSILALASCVAPRQASERQGSVLEGLLIGLIAGMLILGKLNFTLAAFFVVAAGAVLRRRSLISWIATVLGCGAVVVLYLIYLHGWAAWIGDVKMLIGVQQSGKRFRVMFNIVANPSTLLDLTLAVLIAALHFRRVLAPEQPARIVGGYLMAVLCAAMLTGIGVFATSGNMQWYAIPLIAVGAVYLAETTRWMATSATAAAREHLANEDRPDCYRLRVTLSCLLATSIVLSITAGDFLSVGYAFAWKRLRGPQMPPDAHIDAAPLKDFIMPPPLYDATSLAEIRAKLPTTEELRTSAYQATRRYNDGLELLKGRVDGNSRILALEANNVFPFALQLPPPRGAPPLWHPGRLESDAKHPPADVVFQEVTHVMVPKIAESDALPFLHHLFDDYLGEHFKVIAESPMWILWERKNR